MNIDSDIKKENPPALWIQDMEHYMLYCDGAYILKLYTDLKSIKTLSYWELVELLQGWMSALDQSFVYGQRIQIANFTKTAVKYIEIISGELRRRKTVPKRTCKVVQPKNGQKLVARQVKLDARRREVWERYFPQMKKVGAKTYRVRCPYPERHAHGDKKASFVVYEDGGGYCPVCNARLDIYDVVMLFEGLSFTEAVGFVYQNFC